MWFSGFFFLILSLIVEVYLWWKLQASLIFLSGRTCTIGGWLNTFLPHCLIILQNVSKQSCSYLDAFLVVRANSLTHTHTQTQTQTHAHTHSHRLLWIQSVYMLSWNAMYHDTGKPAERLLMVEHSPCQPWKSCVPCYRKTCPSKPE